MGMAGYTKLFNSILASTIWRENDKTRIVWITLLAMADKNGVAEGSLPGLADMARVSIPDCEAALEKLKSPDSYSRTKEHEGRRIEECEGGWQILNHRKFRQKLCADERREYFRDKQAEHRAKKADESTNVKDCQTMSKESNSSTVPYVSGDASESDSVPELLQAESGPDEVYALYPRKVGKPEALKAIKKAAAKVGYPKLLAATKLFSETYDGDIQYCPHPSKWFNQERFNDDPKTWKRENTKSTRPPTVAENRRNSIRTPQVARNVAAGIAKLEREQAERDANNTPKVTTQDTMAMPLA